MKAKPRFYSLFFLLILLVIGTACSLYIQLAEKQSPSIPLISLPSSPPFCPTVHHSEQFALLSQRHQSNLEHFLDQIKKQWPKLSFIEKAVLFSMMQMNFAPHLTTPSSPLYVLINYKGQQYYAFTHPHLESSTDTATSSNQTWPFLYGLETLLKKYDGRRSMEQLASLLDTHFTKYVNTSESFAHFLNQHKNTLLKISIFQQHFFKAEHPITQGETIPKLNFTSIIKTYRAKIKQTSFQKPLTSNQLNSKPDSNNQTNLSKIRIDCNFDYNLYQNSSFMIKNNPSENHSFAFQDKNGNSFIGVTSQSFDNIQPLAKTFLVAGTPPEEALAMCLLHHPNSKTDLSLISTSGRDPGQYLYNLILYNVFNAQELEELFAFLHFPRHLFLLDPIRMIYESEKGSPDQLNRFLSLDFPIYHHEQLGLIWAHLKSPSNPSGLIIDNRKPSALLCH